MNDVQHAYDNILKGVRNADGPSFEIGQLRGEIWKLCCQVAESDFQVPYDPDYKFWWTSFERDDTTYHVVIAHELAAKPYDWFLWEVQVKGSNIYEVLSQDFREDFFSMTYKEMMNHEI